MEMCRRPKGCFGRAVLFSTGKNNEVVRKHIKENIVWIYFYPDWD